MSDIKKVVSMFPDLPLYHSIVYPNAMEKPFKACGKETDIVYYPLTAVDVNPYVNSVVQKNPDFVNFTGIGAQAVQVFKTFQQNGISADKIASTDVDTTPASGGTASGTSVVASATTGMPRCIASRSDSPSEVHRIGCKYTRRRAISAWSTACGGFS